MCDFVRCGTERCTLIGRINRSCRVRPEAKARCAAEARHRVQLRLRHRNEVVQEVLLFLCGLHLSRLECVVGFVRIEVCEDGVTQATIPVYSVKAVAG